MSVKSRTYERDTMESVELPKTLMLVNNFVFTTMEFLNNMSETCEKKIASVATRINQLEILASVLEAKLDSMPDSIGDAPKLQRSSSDGTATQAPTEDTAQAGAPAAPPAPGPPPPGEGGPAPPAPDAPAPPEGEPAEPEEPAELPGVACKDHPDYAPFFKLQRLRVPKPVLEQKMAAAGLDPAMLNDPEFRIVD